MNRKRFKFYCFLFPIFFYCQNIIGQTTNKDISISNIKDSIYTNPDILPDFEGGTDSLYKFIKTYLVYPQMALDNRIEGSAVFKVIIEKDGSITNITQVRRIGWMMDEEALKLIKLMPKWIPGKVNEVPVRCHYTLKIKFEYPVDAEN
jgi:periplasmic protein TonB